MIEILESIRNTRVKLKSENLLRLLLFDPIMSVMWNLHNYNNEDPNFLTFQIDTDQFSGTICLSCNKMDLMDIHFISEDGILVDEINDVVIFDLLKSIDNKVQKLNVEI